MGTVVVHYNTSPNATENVALAFLNVLTHQFYDIFCRITRPPIIVKILTVRLIVKNLTKSRHRVAWKLFSIILHLAIDSPKNTMLRFVPNSQQPPRRHAMFAKTLVTAPNGQQIWMTAEQKETLETLIASQAGGFAAVKGYVPTTGYVESPVINLQMLTRFSTERLYARRIDALASINFTDVQPLLANVDKLSALSVDAQREVFETRKAMETASLQKTIDGDRSDNRRQGHDRCFVPFAKGIKVHLETESERYTDEDGKRKSRKVPVITDGFPTADSIMVMHLELNRTTVKDGQRKHVNSGAPVLMSNAIKRLMNDRSVGIRSVTLREGNFEKVTIDRNVILPENVASLV